MDYFIHIGTLAAIYAIAVLGLNYAAGYGGLLSLSHSAFMGIGAFTVAILLKTLGFSFPVALLLAGLVPGVVAFLVSFPLLRLKGDAFVLVSFGFAFIISEILLNWTSLTNGALGFTGIPQPSSLLLWILLVLAAVVLCLRAIVMSSYGVIIKAVRENQKVTEIAGHDGDAYRRSVFVVSAVITGFSGALLACFISAIDPFLFQYHLSILLLIMAILGGLGSLKGSVAGALMLIILPEALRFIGLPNSILAESQQIIYGLVLMALMVWRPVGLFGHYRL